MHTLDIPERCSADKGRFCSLLDKGVCCTGLVCKWDQPDSSAVMDSDSDVLGIKSGLSRAPAWVWISHLTSPHLSAASSEDSHRMLWMIKRYTDLEILSTVSQVQ